MKTAQQVIQISRYVFTSMAILGALFKLQHWLGASQLLIVGMCGLALTFALQVLMPDKRTIADFLWNYGIALIIISVLFKLQHWPGVESMRLIGLGILTIGGFIKYIYKLPVKKQDE